MATFNHFDCVHFDAKSPLTGTRAWKCMRIGRGIARRDQTFKPQREAPKSQLDTSLRRSAGRMVLVTLAWEFRSDNSIMSTHTCVQRPPQAGI